MFYDNPGHLNVPDYWCKMLFTDLIRIVYTSLQSQHDTLKAFKNCLRPIVWCLFSHQEPMYFQRTIMPI